VIAAGRAVLAFAYDFIVGDDWRIAAGVVMVLIVGGAAVRAGASASLVTIGVAACVIGVAFAGIVGTPRRD